MEQCAGNPRSDGDEIVLALKHSYLPGPGKFWKINCSTVANMRHYLIIRRNRRERRQKFSRMDEDSFHFSGFVGCVDRFEPMGISQQELADRSAAQRIKMRTTT
jgi:hypothetical protein